MSDSWDSAAAAADDPIRAFWSWWHHEGARLLDRVFTGNSDADPVALVAPRIEAVHPDLEWEFGPGPKGSRHILTVTAAGDPRLRATARRWLDSAPDNNATWAFADMRPPTPSSVLTIDDHHYALDEALVSIDTGLSLLHVSLYHPSFALPGPDPDQVTYLLLDSLLGERNVELWIGAITATTTPGADAIALTGLVDAVTALRHVHAPSDDGTPQWHLLRADTPNGPSLATVRPPLSPASAPTLSRHLAITLPYQDTTEDGLPASSSLESLRAFEDALTTSISSYRLVATETCNGARVFHLYGDPATEPTPTLADQVNQWAQGPAHVDCTDDPGWQSVHHLRV